MATINISDLHPTGSELFYDSESYLNELMDNELNLTHGGGFTIAIATTPYCAAALSVTAVTLVTYVSYTITKE